MSMTDDNSIRVKRNEAAVWRVIDGEVVVLLPETDSLHALGGCGDRIWELLENETTVASIVDVICEEYEVEPETARKDITKFIQRLKNLNLAEIIAGVNEEVRP